MIEDIDYRTLSDADIAGIVEANRDELHAGCLTAGVILKDLELNRAIIHRCRHGFYIIQIENKEAAYLWILYVDPKHRGNGIGSNMLDEAIATYANELILHLRCNKSLLSFYGNLGFYTYEVEDGMHHMVGPFEDGEYDEWRLYARL